MVNAEPLLELSRQGCRAPIPKRFRIAAWEAKDHVSR